MKPPFSFFFCESEPSIVFGKKEVRVKCMSLVLVRNRVRLVIPRNLETGRVIRRWLITQRKIKITGFSFKTLKISG